MTGEQPTLDLSAARTARDDGIASVEANSHEERVYRCSEFQCGVGARLVRSW